MNRRLMNLQHQRDRDRLEHTGRAALWKIDARAQMAVVSAVGRGFLDEVPQIATTILREMGPVFLDALVNSHLYGWMRTTITVAPKIKPAIQLSAFDDAVKFARWRLGLSEPQLASLRQLYGDYAVNMTNGVSGALEGRLRKAVAEVIESGLHVQGGTAALREATSRIIGEFTRAGLTRQNGFLIETVYRTQVNLAYMAGRMNGNADPIVNEMLWGYEYVTAEDDRVRPNHEALHGLRLPKDHPRWNEITPPNGFNCRCDLIEVFIDDAPDLRTVNDVKAIEIDGKLVEPKADTGWEFNPGELYKDTMELVRA